MEAPKTIEHEIGGLKNDALRFGLQGVKSDIVGSHPLESAFQSANVREEQMKRKILANTYGSAFSLKQEFDRKILSRYSFHLYLGFVFLYE
ncbi:putative proteasome maturation factor Ump1 [Helianthus anomalus]